MSKKAQEANDNQEKTATKVIILKKISIKGICGKPSLVDGQDEKYLCRVVGIATGTKVVTTTFGDSTGLKGAFKAYDMEGTTYRAAIAWLPDVITDTISAALGMSEGEFPSIQFGFDISIVRRDDLPIGYEYVCKPLTQEVNDPFQVIEKDLPPMLTA